MFSIYWSFEYLEVHWDISKPTQDTPLKEKLRKIWGKIHQIIQDLQLFSEIITIANELKSFEWNSAYQLQKEP